jgi:hypothetical protein
VWITQRVYSGCFPLAKLQRTVWDLFDLTVCKFHLFGIMLWVQAARSTMGTIAAILNGGSRKLVWCISNCLLDTLMIQINCNCY